MIVARLKEYRKLNDVTQKSVAIAINVSERAYQHYELGTREPNHDNLVMLCRYLNVSADYLLGLTDTPTPLYRKEEDNE